MPLEELDDTGLKVPKPSQVFFPLPRAFVFLAVLLSVSQHAASLRHLCSSGLDPAQFAQGSLLSDTPTGVRC